jgi:hypothetical protein
LAFKPSAQVEITIGFLPTELLDLLVKPENVMADKPRELSSKNLRLCNMVVNDVRV